MEDKKMPGRRLLQLAINDAVQSRLCLISPIKSQMEREKRDRRNKNCKVNKITLWTENTHQNSRLAPNRFSHENMKGIENFAYEAKHNYHSNIGLHNAKNQDKRLPSSRHVFNDKNKNEFSKCMKNNYISVPFNSKSRSQDMLQFSTAPRKKSDMMPASVDYKWRDVKTSSTSCDFEGSSTNPPVTHQAFVDSQLICSSSNCDSKSVKVPAMHSNTELNSDYDLPMFSQSCELGKTSDNNNFKGLGTFSESHEEGNMSEIPKMSSNLLKHLTLHSLDNSSIQSKEESFSSNNFIQPQAGSHRFSVSEQNTLSNSEIEIPVPLHSVDQTYSSTCNVMPAQEHFDSFSDNSTPNDKMIAQRSLSPVNAAADFLKNNTVINHYLKSDPHLSTLKHFRGLISEKNPPLITVTTDNLELKIVAHHSQLDDYDTGCPISKPHAIGAEPSGTRSACESNINRHDCLLDYFLNLNAKCMHDETPLTSSNLTNTNALNDNMSFGNNLHSTKSNGNIFFPEMNGDISNRYFEYKCKSNLEKLTEESSPCMGSSNLLQHFPDSRSALLNMNIEFSKSNPCTNDHLHDKRNKDDLIYSENFTAKQSTMGCYSEIFPSKLQSETLNPNYFNSESNLSNPTNSLFNPDVSMNQICSSISDNVPINHFDSLNPGHYNNTNTLNSLNTSHGYCLNSKHGRSVEVLRSTSSDNSTDFRKHSVSQFSKGKHDYQENSTLKSKSMDKVSSNLDSGIGLMSEDRGYNSKWDLSLISSERELNVPASMQEKMHGSNNSKTTVTTDCNADNLQLCKNILSSTKLKFSLSIPFNEYENDRIQGLIEKFKGK